jgi:hypothetical protein
MKNEGKFVNSALSGGNECPFWIGPVSHVFRLQAS